MIAKITLEPDVADRIERLSRERATSADRLANQALREGLAHLSLAETEPEAGRATYTHPVTLEGCLTGNLDDIQEALAAAEGHSFR